MNMRFIQVFFRDVAHALRRNKAVLLLLAALTICGAVLGTVFFRLWEGGWHCNRLQFARLIACGNFFTFLLRQFCTLLILCALLTVCGTFPSGRFLCCPLCFVLGLYFGAHLSALLAGGVAWALFVLPLLAELAVNALCCYLAFLRRGCRKSFGESVRDNGDLLLLQCGAFVVTAVLTAILRGVSSLL